MPSKDWDEEGSDSSSSPESPRAAAAGAGRRKFDDEEDDGDVLDSWDAAEDSEEEREKERKAAEEKAKTEAAAAAARKAKAEKTAKAKAAKAKAEAEAEAAAEAARARANASISVSMGETDADRRARIRAEEKDADLDHAADLFGEVGINPNRKPVAPSSAVPTGSTGGNTVNIGALPLWTPTTKPQFEQLRNTIAPLIAANSKKAHYAPFLQDFVKALAAELPSDQIKKVSSSLTTLSNEKLKAEKAADKGGKKSKAAKTKTSLVVNSRVTEDASGYDDYGDDDFM